MTWGPNNIHIASPVGELILAATKQEAIRLRKQGKPAIGPKGAELFATINNVFPGARVESLKFHKG